LTMRRVSAHCSFTYSALASFRMGMSGSASFQRAQLRFTGASPSGAAGGSERNAYFPRPESQPLTIKVLEVLRRLEDWAGLLHDLFGEAKLR
jgi:hypothetical protein